MRWSCSLVLSSCQAKQKWKNCSFKSNTSQISALHSNDPGTNNKLLRRFLCTRSTYTISDTSSLGSWRRILRHSLFFSLLHTDQRDSAQSVILCTLKLTYDSKYHLIEGCFLITRPSDNVFVICWNITAQYRWRLFGLQVKTLKRVTTVEYHSVHFWVLKECHHQNNIFDSLIWWTYAISAILLNVMNVISSDWLSMLSKLRLPKYLSTQEQTLAISPLPPNM